jgi:hypothetical protein
MGNLLQLVSDNATTPEFIAMQPLLGPPKLDTTIYYTALVMVMFMWPYGP